MGIRISKLHSPEYSIITFTTSLHFSDLFYYVDFKCSYSSILQSTVIVISVLLLISMHYCRVYVSLSVCLCITLLPLIVFQVFANSMTLALQSVFRNLQVCTYLRACAGALCKVYTVVVCGVMWTCTKW